MSFVLFLRLLEKSLDPGFKKGDGHKWWWVVGGLLGGGLFVLLQHYNHEMSGFDLTKQCPIFPYQCYRLNLPSVARAALGTAVRVWEASSWIMIVLDTCPLFAEPSVEQLAPSNTILLHYKTSKARWITERIDVEIVIGQKPQLETSEKKIAQMATGVRGGEKPRARKGNCLPIPADSVTDNVVYDRGLHYDADKMDMCDGHCRTCWLGLLLVRYQTPVW
jgi:hypothetical protein